MKRPVEFLHPHGLPKSPGASQVVVVRGPARRVLVGPQTALDVNGRVVAGGLREQAVRTLRNMEIALAAAGVTDQDVVRWALTVVDGQRPEAALDVFQRLWRQRSHPPLLSFSFVSGLAHPELLLQVELEAVVGEA